jgi:hypothetical protein
MSRYVVGEIPVCRIAIERTFSWLKAELDLGPVGVVRLVQGEASLKRVVKAHVVDRLVDRLFDEQRRDGGELGDPWSSRVRPATTLESRRPCARIGLTRPSSIAAYASCSQRRSGSAFSRTRTATRRRLLQRQRRKRGAGFGTPHRHSLDRPLGQPDGCPPVATGPGSWVAVIGPNARSIRKAVRGYSAANVTEMLTNAIWGCPHLCSTEKASCPRQPPCRTWNPA